MNFFNHQEINLKQNQKLIFTLAMQQALHVLQMPMQELSEWLKDQIELNPALEFKEEEEKKGYYTGHRGVSLEQQQDIYTPSLFEFLMQQATHHFREEDLKIAEWIIGNLDERGFFGSELPDQAYEILLVIQTFDPPGIAAANLQESFLLQLKRKKKENTLAFKIINHHFHDLLHHRLFLLSKKVKCSLKIVKEAIQKDLSCLNLRPAAGFKESPSSFLIPDIVLENQEGKWVIEINKQVFPAFGLSSNFAGKTTGSHLVNEEKTTVRGFTASGKWLMRNVARRHQTLKQIAGFIIKHQEPFLNGECASILPLSIKEMSIELGIHGSTLTRALYKKTIACPRGLFPLKIFFTHGGTEVSKQNAQELLVSLVRGENKSSPFTDQELAEQIVQKGVRCSRRTITKYRKLMNIPSSSHRKL